MLRHNILNSADDTYSSLYVTVLSCFVKKSRWSSLKLSLRSAVLLYGLSRDLMELQGGAVACSIRLIWGFQRNLSPLSTPPPSLGSGPTELSSSTTSKEPPSTATAGHTPTQAGSSLPRLISLRSTIYYLCFCGSYHPIQHTCPLTLRLGQAISIALGWPGLQRRLYAFRSWLGMTTTGTKSKRRS